MSSQSTQQYSDLVIPAANIQSFAKMDLSKLSGLPGDLADLFALSVRLEAVFLSVLDPFLQLIAKDHEKIPREVFDEWSADLALDFIERYGVLALFSPTILRALWEAQRPTSAKGPERLRQVGQRLAIFALANKGRTPKIAIDISFKVYKPLFLRELERLSRELGNSSPDNPWADQMLHFVRAGEYPMLKFNLTLLERFLRSQETDPDPDAKNTTAVNLLAAYGRGRVLGEHVKPSMTPDWFFYTWIAWTTNKRASTVRREIQTAEAKLKRKIAALRVTKNR
jgi:hypothetical protein